MVKLSNIMLCVYSVFCLVHPFFIDILLSEKNTHSFFSDFSPKTLLYIRVLGLFSETFGGVNAEIFV